MERSSLTEYILRLLEGTVYPETGEGLVSSGIAHPQDISVEESGGVVSVDVTLQFKRQRDPFAAAVVRRVKETLAHHLPEARINVQAVEGSRPAPKPQEKKTTFTQGIGCTIAVASGKGGVGKSTVTANLALALRDLGLKVAVLDADIYGPSLPKMFGCEDFQPEAEHREGTDVMLPAEVQGIKLMSIGFFVSERDAMLWRGPMATNALRQMINQTLWGDVDILLTDLPPGTGDIHLSIISELKIDGAVIVTTPQAVAVADVVRGVEMFRNPNVNIPVLGIVENMAWFTPEELPDNRYYIFGRGGAAERYAAETGIEILEKVPLIQGVAECADEGVPAVVRDSQAAPYYRSIAEKIVEKVKKGVDKA